jgi:Cu2+-exporting ATPase
MAAQYLEEKNVNNQEQTPRRSVPCVHCGTPTISTGDTPAFCCSGCEHVYAFLHDAELDDFYSIRSDSDRENAIPAALQEGSFAYFDDPTFAEDYLRKGEDGLQEISFFIEGIHCTACIWLLEQLPHVCPMVLRARLNYSTSQLTIGLSVDAKLSEIARVISSLGYTPRVIQEDAYEQEYRKESIRLLYRLGIAAVSAGNCMLIAVSLYEGAYSGMEQGFALLFTLLSALIALPVVLYSAQPFYRAALNGLRQKRAHVDLPISIGVVGGYLLSCISVLRGSDAVYFDSISILVFLMLTARVIQRYTLKRVSDMRTQLRGFLPQSVWLLQDGVEKEVYREALQPQDRIIVRSGERVPADGVLKSQSAIIDTSVLTGESRPVPAASGDLLYAGSINIGDPIELSVEKPPRESRIHSFFSSSKQQIGSAIARQGSRAPTKHIELLSQWFVSIVLIVAIGCFSYWAVSVDLAHASEVTLAFLIVTCPCALGLAGPLLLAKAVANGIGHGIFVSDPNGFEHAVRGDTFFFDKTGTLTDSSKLQFSLMEYQEGRWCALDVLPSHLGQIVLALEKDISHPIADTFRRVLSSPESGVVLQEREVHRTGISARDPQGVTCSIGSREYFHETFPSFSEAVEQLSHDQGVVYFQAEGLLFAFLFQERLQEGAEDFISWCRSRLKKKIVVLSGDDPAAVQRIGQKLDIDTQNLLGGLAPEEKAERIEGLSAHSIMVGDGANDAPAFQVAELAIGLRGGAEQLLSVADVYIQSGTLRDLRRFFVASLRTVRTLRWSYTFSVFYNVIVGVAAVFGQISPLLAAILMPLSSFTVISIAVLSNPFKES